MNYNLPDINTAEELAELMNISVEELNWLSYNKRISRMRHYYKFYIAKSNGSDRQIQAPTAKLKIAQQWILINILNKLPVHDAAHGFISNRSTYSNALPHNNNKLIIKLDLKDFFSSIKITRVKHLFKSIGYSDSIAEILSVLCTDSDYKEIKINNKIAYKAISKRYIPQGAPTSPSISNALFIKIDNIVTELANMSGFTYTRYADDLTFSTSNIIHNVDIRNFINRIITVVKVNGFTIQESKTKILPTKVCQNITGLIVNNGPPRVPRRTRRMIRAATDRLSKGKELKHNQTPEVIQGYLAYVNMTDKTFGDKYKI
jgi:RNA-directed DNA polymerase